MSSLGPASAAGAHKAAASSAEPQARPSLLAIFTLLGSAMGGPSQSAVTGIRAPGCNATRTKRSINTAARPNGSQQNI
jgi:hypothetical protein